MTKIDTVRPGDGWLRIAARNGSAATRVAAENGLTVSDPLFPGRLVLIPHPGVAAVELGRICGRCRRWVQTTPESGFCTRWPPDVKSVVDGEDVLKYPTTRAGERCGEWQARA